MNKCAMSDLSDKMQEQKARTEAAIKGSKFRINKDQGSD